MKKRHLLIVTLASILTLGVVVPQLFKKSESIDVGDDPIVYNKDSSVVSFDEPHLRASTRAGDDDEDESVGPVSKVIIHYVNDDFKCATRAFYIWANAIDGIEYSDEVELLNGESAVEYAKDGSSMTITMDLNNDPRFTAFKDLPSISYIIKYKMKGTEQNWAGQSDDVTLVYAEFPPVNEVVEVWATPAAGGGMAQFATEEETKVDGVKLAKFSDWKTIHCLATPDTKTVKWDLYAFDQNYYRVKLKKRDAIKNNFKVLSGENALTDTNKEFDIEFPYTAKINMVYCLVSKDVTSTSNLAKTVYVSADALYDTPKFEKYYCYEGNDLGMTYTKAFTTFKVWSPVSANMTLFIYDKWNDAPAVFQYFNDKDKEKEILEKKPDKYLKGWHMTYSEGGIWELTVLGDLEGYYYNFQVDNINGTTQTVDPYVTAVGCSGSRGLVYDKNKAEYSSTNTETCNPTGWSTLPLVWDGDVNLDIKTPQELSIYEVHVRDFTGDSSWNGPAEMRGTYNGFVKEGTKVAGTTVTTGFDHLKELGINTVQLMPVFDADNDESDRGVNKYNWGYNPQNYNAVEGAYCSNPHDGLTRIREYKNLILQLGKAGIRVTMDVVYNHVSSVSASPFTKLMPKYYFRYDENGELYDGSGCHNEVRSDAKMVSKFIVDSVVMWAKEYKVKGFRFDLMGLIDYRTMNRIKDELSKIDRDIYVYGEGWTAGDYHGSNYYTGSASTWQVYKYCNNFDPITGYDNEYKCYVGCFNDTGRNAVKGENGGWGEANVYPKSGFIQGNEDNDYVGKVVDMVWGIHRNVSNSAKQTVNYVSCHDNWTVVDQLYNTINGNNPGKIADIVRGSLAAHSLVFASNGVAFMLGGEEIFRTKEIKFDPSDRKELMNTYTVLHNRYISHNSYNAPLEVNSFKWGNKVSLTLDNNTITNSEYNYNDAWKSLVALHKKVKFQAPHHRSEIWPNGITSAGNVYQNLSWRGYENPGLGIQLDELFIYVFGVNGGLLQYDYDLHYDYEHETKNSDYELFDYGVGHDRGEKKLWPTDKCGVFVARRTA